MIHEKLAEIQRTLKAPKSNFNAFGKYSYRSAEDILEAVKPLLGDSILTLSDEIVHIGDRYYVKALAILSGDGMVSTTAYAREEETKKGIDAAQITGAASSYARKYCLSGLFLLDDTKDPDSTNTHDSKPVEAYKPPTPTPTLPQAQKPVVEAPMLVKPGSTGKGGPINEAQIKRLFTIANASDKTKADIVIWLGERGMKSSKELDKENYDQLCAWIETPKAKEPAPETIICPDNQERPLSWCDACPIEGPCPNRPGE